MPKQSAIEQEGVIVETLPFANALIVTFIILKTGPLHLICGLSF